jgi:hypothetical protein
MTTFQTGANVLVALHRESTTGVAATATGAVQMRAIQSPGLALNRAQIQSQEKRSDGLRTMGRLGGKDVSGSYNAELTVGGATDMLLEAIMRGAWATATSIGFATMTTVAIGSNTLTAAGGDWINTQGIRVGDVFYLSSTTVSGNNNTNARVVSVTTLTITTQPGAFTTLAATATGTLTILKKLKNGATPVRYSHTVEQYNQDIDVSELFLGCRAINVKASFKPGAMAQISYSFLGLDRTALATGTSPYFTSPTLTTGLDLIADDSTIRYNGANIATFTGFDLDLTITAKGEPVIGSFVSPDVFDNDMMVSGTITALRSDFSNLTLYDAETEFDVSILLQEPSGTPKAALAFFLPRVKISALSAPFAGDGAMQETLTLMVGPKTAATGYDAGYLTIHSSGT